MESYSEKLLLQFGDKFGTMVVRVWKPETSLATVFCFHGYECNGSDFEYLARFLVAKGYTVVCPDMIGRGESTYFGSLSMYTYGTYFTCIGALSKYAGDKNHFIGTSWGGALILYFLCVTRVKAETLILNDVGMRNNPTVDYALNFIAADAQQVFDTLEEAQSYVRRTRGFLGQFPEELWPHYLENKIRFIDGKFRLAYDPALADRMPTVAGKKFDFFPLLEKVPARILLLYGADSQCYEPEMVADLMRRFANVSCIPNLRAGHPPSLMTYDQALMIGGFLSG
jgi:pimeloyl-ACP methyl ester carboxylesterase